MPESRTALVLSAGGMFGAWQAGVWEALAEQIQPDLVVGASVGSLNGWAIAGGCTPAELEILWSEIGVALKMRLHVPRSLVGGVLDSDPLRAVVRDLHARYRPRIPYALVLTNLLRLRPEIIHGPDVTWTHLVASCAVPGIFDQYRINGTLYSDGGLLAAVPAWAAAKLGATRIIAINALPRLSSVVGRVLNRGLRTLSPFRPQVPPEIEMVTIVPAAPLGSVRDMFVHQPDKIARWIEEGRCAGRRYTASVPR